MHQKSGLFSVLALVLLFAACDPSGKNAPWSKFAGNNRNNGLAGCCDYSTYKYDNAKVRCFFETKGTVRSSPIIGANGWIYFGSDDGNIYAIDSACHQQWSYDAHAAVKSSPALRSDGMLYVGTQNGVVALRASDGFWRWSAPIGAVGFSSPLIGLNYVFIGSGRRMFALDPETGATIQKTWPVDTQVSGGEISSPAYGPNGLVYFAIRDFVYGFTEQGTKVWEQRLPFFSNSATPSVGADGTVYIGSDNGALTAMNGDHGNIEWQFVPRAWVGSGNNEYNFGSPAVIFSGGGDTLFVTDGAFIYRISAKTHEVKWAQACSSTLLRAAPAVVREGPIFVGNDQFLVIMRSDNHLPIKFVDLDQNRPSSSAGIGADGTIYIGAGKRLYAVR